MLTTTGFTFFASVISRQISSLAKELPPGEFTLNTIALTSLSSRTLRSSFINVSPPISSSLPSPPTISPCAYTIAILSSPFCVKSTAFSYLPRAIKLTSWSSVLPVFFSNSAVISSSYFNPSTRLCVRASLAVCIVPSLAHWCSWAVSILRAADAANKKLLYRSPSHTVVCRRFASVICVTRKGSVALLNLPA